LLETIGKLFPESKKGTNTITYVDEEGDLITISSDFDYDNCKQLVKKLSLSVLKMNVENTNVEVNSENLEELISTTSRAVTSADVKIEDVKECAKEKHIFEEKKEEQKEDAKTFEKVEENIKNLIQNGYGNIKEFVDSNGGVQNMFALFKDDIMSLKENVCSAFKGGFPGIKRECGKKEGKSRKEAGIS